MTLYSALAMAGGLAILGYLPLPKDKALARSSQGAGAVLFAGGLIGMIWGLLPPMA